MVVDLFVERQDASRETDNPADAVHHPARLAILDDNFRLRGGAIVPLWKSTELIRRGGTAEQQH
jgi:hypothetical protein